MSIKWTFVRVVYHENPRGQARRAQTDWQISCKGGALLSTKSMFVHVVNVTLYMSGAGKPA